MCDEIMTDGNNNSEGSDYRNEKNDSETMNKWEMNEWLN